MITILLSLTGLLPGLEVLPCVAGDFLWVPELVDPPPSVLVGFFTNTFQVDGPVPSFGFQVGLQASATLLLVSALTSPLGGFGEYLSEDER